MLLRGLEELVAPVHGRPKGLLALGEIAGTAAQQSEPVVEPVAEHVWREQGEAGGRELDRERQAVEPAADLRDGGGVVVGQREIRVDDARAVDEQSRRPRTRRWPRRGLTAVGRRERERGNGEDLLSSDVERLSTRGEDRQLRAGAQQAGDDGRRFGDLLEVVEDDQHPALPEVVGELVLEIALDDLAQPDGARDRHEDGIRVPDAGQVDEGHAVPEPTREVAGHADGERRLARAAGSRERQQADGPRGQAIGDLPDLVGPADERGHPRRQVGAPAPPGGDQRGERGWQVRGGRAGTGAPGARGRRRWCSPRSRRPAPSGSRSVASAPADAESSTWPP